MKGRSNSQAEGTEITQKALKKSSVSSKKRTLVALTVLLMISVMAIPMIPVTADVSDTDTSDLSTPLSASWNGSVAAGFGGGAGSSGDPWQIGTPEQLAYLAETVNNGTAPAGKYYVLTADIYLNSDEDLALLNVWSNGLGPRYSWTPIGNDINPFKGNFDGAGHKVCGLYISTAANYQGLFGFVKSSSISDVGVEQSYIRGIGSTGGVIGHVSDSSTVTNCYNAGNVSGSGNVGGVIGHLYNFSTVTNCYNTGNVTGSGNEIGGIAGTVNIGSNIKDCYNTGNVISNGNRAGGVAGNFANNSTIANCYNTGNVSAAGNQVGGLTGITQSSSVITNCYNTGNVTGTTNVGGIAGTLQGSNSTVTNSYNAGSVTGAANIGGVAGDISGTVKFCYYLNNGVPAGAGTSFDQDGILTTAVTVGTVTSDVLLNVLNAWVTGPALGANNYTSWVASADAARPMLVGSTAGTVSSSPDFAGGTGTASDPYQIANAKQLKYLSQVINADTADSTNGGRYNDQTKYYVLISDICLNDISMVNWQASAQVWVPIGSNVYAFAANFDGKGLTVSGIYISSGSSIGLFGYVSGNISNVGVENSYITGASYVGGVAGHVYNGSIRNCYNTGSVNGNMNSGGVVGYVDGGSITNCYNGGILTFGSGGNVGGVAGQVHNSSITNCYNTGSIASSGINVGGVAGHVHNGSIRNCYNTGSVNGNNFIGGVAGATVGKGMIMNCYNAGGVSGQNYIGGLTGSSMFPIENSYNTGTVTCAGNSAGGLTAYADDHITNCYNAGSVTGTSDVGALVGETDGSWVTLSYCYFLNTSASSAIGSGSAAAESVISSFTWAGSKGTLTTAISVGGRPASADLNEVLNSWVDFLGGGGYLNFAPGVSYLRFNGLHVPLPAINLTISGYVMSSGSGVCGAEIGFTVNGVPDSVITDHDGSYSIQTDSGSMFRFISVTRTGLVSADPLPMAAFKVQYDTVQNFTMTPDPAYVPLTVTITGSGSVNINGTVYVSSETVYLAAGSTAALTASTANFTGWSGDVTSNTADVSVVMSAARSVTATFDASGNSVIDLVINGTGSVNANSVVYDSSVMLYFAAGTPVVLSEISSSPWAFSHWTIDQTVYLDQTRSLTVTSDMSVYVLFLDTGSSRSVTATADPLTGGTVTWAFIDKGVIVTRTGSGYAPASADVTLSVTADPAYEFICWSGSIAGTSATVTSPASDGNMTATANLALKTDVITFAVKIKGPGTVSVIINGTQVSEHTSSFTFSTSVNWVTELNASPAEKCTFSHWSVNGSDVRDNKITLSPGDSVTAVFSEGPDWYWPILVLILTCMVLTAFFWLIWRIRRREEEDEVKELWRK